MPISLNQPTIVTIDKLRIDQFIVHPKNKTITIHYSKGYEDQDGNYVPKEFAGLDLRDVEFDPTLYSQVKDVLYSLLTTELEEINSQEK